MQKSLKAISDYQNIMGVWHVVVMMEMEISCNDHCEKLSRFLDHVSHCKAALCTPITRDKWEKKFANIIDRDEATYNELPPLPLHCLI